MTVNEIFDRNLWDEVCEMKGFSVWCVNEGTMLGTDEITFNKSEAVKLGLLKMN